MRDVTPKSCERARRWISLRLDDELSLFESRLLDAHTDRCADCRSYEASAARSTTQLRSTPLEPLSRPVALPQPRRGLGAWARVGSAAAAAVGVVAFAGVFAFSGAQETLVAAPNVKPGVNLDVPDVKSVRRASMVPGPPRPAFTHQASARPDRI